MAQDIFLRLAGIPGEAQEALHKNEIEVISWAWAVSQPTLNHIGGGGGAGKATVGDMLIDHYVDRSSPNLMKYCLLGKHIDSATLAIRKAGCADRFGIQANKPRREDQVALPERTYMRRTTSRSACVVFRHPTVSRKNLTEASTARW